MHIGMLWFDNSPNLALKIKIAKAVEFYRQKYHRDPNLCLIHPSMFGAEKSSTDDLAELKGMTVRPYRPVLPGHLWIGIEEKD
jgi:hypothetical protein